MNRASKGKIEPVGIQVDPMTGRSQDGRIKLSERHFLCPHCSHNLQPSLGMEGKIVVVGITPTPVDPAQYRDPVTKVAYVVVVCGQYPHLYSNLVNYDGYAHLLPLLQPQEERVDVEELVAA